MKLISKLIILTLTSVLLAALFAFIILKDAFNTSFLNPKPPNLKNVNILDNPASQYQFNTLSQYGYHFYKADKNEKIALLSNFREKLTSLKILENTPCKFLINAGFYSEENSPLGVFIENGKTLSSPIQSALFNGYVYELKNKSRAVDSLFSPQKDYNWAVQTGPMLIQKGNPLKLKIRNDYEARRMVCASDGSGNLIFMALFDKDHLRSGPLLADLGEIISAVNQKENLNIENAVNLDGGNASSYIAENFTLYELNSIGSAFCVY